MEALASREIVKLTILHTNDMHSHIDPFPANDPKYPGLGGMERRAALINKIRKEEENLLLLDAGDVFQGTPYFNLYGGELEFKLMSKMGYDACTIGNHDFDNGLNGLARMLPHANFPFICANYDFSDTVMFDKTIPYKIFEKRGIRVGVFGLGIELDGLVGKKFYGNTIYQNPVEVSEKISRVLKEDWKCDLVVCLSHLGFKYQTKKIDDMKLAKTSKYIDLIIGGHTHSFLDEPVFLKNKNNKKVVINQVGWAGLRVGRIDFFLDRKTKKNVISGTGYIVNNFVNFG